MACCSWRLRAACAALLVAAASSSGKCSCEPPGGVEAAAARSEYWAPKALGGQGESLAELAEALAIDGTLVLMMANAGALPMLENHACSLARNGVSKYLVFATAPAARDLFVERGFHAYYDAAPLAGLNLTAESARNHKPDFLALMLAKLAILGDVLRLGYDVLLTDVDIVWFENLLPRLHAECRVDGVDMCLMHDGPSKPSLQANTGFWWLRASEENRAFLAAAVELKQSSPGHSEQAVVNKLLINPREGAPWAGVRAKILPSSEYVNGHMMQHDEALPKTMVMAHINWTRTRGQKKRAFKKWAMWYCGG